MKCTHCGKKLPTTFKERLLELYIRVRFISIYARPNAFCSRDCSEYFKMMEYRRWDFDESTEG